MYVMYESIKERKREIEIKGNGKVGLNGSDCVYLTPDKAENYMHTDCGVCEANLKLAKKYKLRCIVNIYTDDIIGVSYE